MNTIHLLGDVLAPLGDKKRSRELPSLVDEKQKLYALLAKAKPGLPANFFPTLDRVVPMFYWAMGKKDWLKVHQFMKTFFPDLKAILTVDVKKWTKEDATYWIKMGCSLRCPILEEEKLQRILAVLDANNLSQAPFNKGTFKFITEEFPFVKISHKQLDLELDLAKYRVFLVYKASFSETVAVLPSPKSSSQTVTHKKVKLEDGAKKLGSSDESIMANTQLATKTADCDLPQQHPLFPDPWELGLDECAFLGSTEGILTGRWLLGLGGDPTESPSFDFLAFDSRLIEPDLRPFSL